MEVRPVISTTLDRNAHGSRRQHQDTIRTTQQIFIPSGSHGHVIICNRLKPNALTYCGLRSGLVQPYHHKTISLPDDRNRKPAPDIRSWKWHLHSVIQYYHPLFAMSLPHYSMCRPSCRRSHSYTRRIHHHELGYNQKSYTSVTSICWRNKRLPCFRWVDLFGSLITILGSAVYCKSNGHNKDDTGGCIACQRRIGWHWGRQRRPGYENRTSYFRFQNRSGMNVHYLHKYWMIWFITGTATPYLPWLDTYLQWTDLA